MCQCDNVAIFQCQCCHFPFVQAELSNCFVQAQRAGFVSPRSGVSVSFGPAAMQASQARALARTVLARVCDIAAPMAATAARRDKGFRVRAVAPSFCLRFELIQTRAA